jgi:hypothetical protein
MEQHSQKIDLSRLASDSASEVASMVNELEGATSGQPHLKPQWPIRFISSQKGAPSRV